MTAGAPDRFRATRVGQGQPLTGPQLRYVPVFRPAAQWNSVVRLDGVFAME